MRKLALVVVPLLMGAAAPSPSFCERLAVPTGMKSVKSASPAAWEVNLLDGLGKALFGGSSVVAIRLEPGDDLDEDHRRRFEESCDSTAKGAFCRVEAPTTLVLTINGREVRQEALVGETATVTVAGSRIRCENN